MRRGTPGWLAIAAVLALAGCTSAAPHPAATPPIPLTHPHVLLSCPAVAATHLETDPADVAEVRRCTADFQDVQGVLNKVQYVRRLTSPPGPLLAAYAEADAPPLAAPDGRCPAETPDPLILWVVLASGDVRAARAPVDGCGQPLAAAVRAVGDAEFETVLVAREVASTLDEPVPGAGG